MQSKRTACFQPSRRPPAPLNEFHFRPSKGTGQLICAGPPKQERPSRRPPAPLNENFRSSKGTGQLICAGPPKQERAAAQIVNKLAFLSYPQGLLMQECTQSEAHLAEDAPQDKST
eukprot:1158271-Pelagomonas_calceolata.AAC.14